MVHNHNIKNSVHYVVKWLAIFHLTAQALGLPFLSPYLQSIGSDYRHGANYATLASTVLLPNTSLFVTGISPFSLAIQINQMKEFKAKVHEFHSARKQGVYSALTIIQASQLCSRLDYETNFGILSCRINTSPITGHFWKISLHVLYWSEWFYFKFSCYWYRWSEAISPSSGCTNCR
jgi:hypothetical protein